MSERDRQNPYDRSHQQGGGYRGGENYDSPRQANQWQSGDDRQQGGYWQQDGNRGDDASREYRFSGQGNASYDAGYQSRESDNSRRYQSERYGQSGSQDQDRGWQDRSRHESRYDQSQYGRGQYEQDRHDSHGGNWSDRDRPSGSGGRYGQQQRSAPYAGRTYDASGGNDFGSFTSEDFGGRDFSNRGGSAVGGMRPSESYRPTYSVSRFFDHDDDDRGNQRDYGRGEDRGFLKRAGDEVASWFGDEDAFRRREQDRREDHRGRGPSGYTRSDDRIREDANDHLTHDWAVDASNITVSVSNGEITLDGTVDSRQAKRRAEDAVEHISGVKHVQNNLRVQERSSSFGASHASGTSGSSQGGSQSSTASDRSTAGHTGSASAGSTSSGSTSSGSSASGSSGGTSTAGTGANTTGGIGSSATAGIGSASTSRSSDKTS